LALLKALPSYRTRVAVGIPARVPVFGPPEGSSQAVAAGFGWYLLSGFPM